LSGALAYKIPISTLVLVHTPDLRVLLLERADYPGYWQSVTGSQEAGESLTQTATRELAEETGIDAAAYGGVVDWQLSNQYEIFARWRHRYPPGTTHNTEHVFSLQVPEPIEVRLAPKEHLAHIWLPWAEAAPKCFSWSNRQAISELPRRAARSVP
jgi:dATP pyrophosphohydrolase